MLIFVLVIVILQLLFIVCCIEENVQILSMIWGRGREGEKRGVIVLYYLLCVCYFWFRVFYLTDYIVFYYFYYVLIFGLDVYNQYYLKKYMVVYMYLCVCIFDLDEGNL